MTAASFEWDARKDVANQAKHGVPFSQAQFAFADPLRVIARDLDHSAVRFTYRGGVIRIIGAGFWRKGKVVYEQENRLHE